MPTFAARPAAEYQRRFGIRPEEAGGLLQLRFARSTGSLVGVYEAVEAGHDGYGFTTLCETHGNLVTHETKTLALHHAPWPEGWCEPCQALADLSAEERAAVLRSEAYVADPSAACALVAEGFRPVPANELTPGDEVACREEWFGAAAGPVKTRQVTSVRPATYSEGGYGCQCGDEPHYCLLLVELDGDAPGHVDGEEPVWRRKATVAA